METELKKCTKCGWTGFSARWVVCPICDQTYYKCPECGSRVMPYRERPYLYTKIRD